MALQACGQLPPLSEPVLETGMTRRASRKARERRVEVGRDYSFVARFLLQQCVAAGFAHDVVDHERRDRCFVTP